MLLVTRVHSRRVFVLGAAGLVPAALVTLLYVHQPSIGDRRLYPTFRGSLALLGLGLALATLITWATAPHRLSRSSLSGLAWAGVTTILCIGPFLESNPRQRLYALDVDSGDSLWDISEVAGRPVPLDGELFVNNPDEATLAVLDPDEGNLLGRYSIEDADTEPRVGRAIAAGAFVPPSQETIPTPRTAPPAAVAGIRLDRGGLQSDGDNGEPWSRSFSGEVVVDFAVAGNSVYAYVSTESASGVHVGAIVKLDVDDGQLRWREPLPPTVAAPDGAADIDATADFVAVAGGEEVGVLRTDTREMLWSVSVVSLGKSRGYALPGARQWVAIDDRRVYLSTNPQG